MSKLSDIKSILISLAVGFVIVNAQETDLILKRVEKCFELPQPTLCLKEEALRTINRTIFTDKPIPMFDGIVMERNPQYTPNLTTSDLPSDITSRNLKLNQALYNGVEELFKSRVLRFNVNDVVEGRKKTTKKRRGGQNKGGGSGKTKIAFLKHGNQMDMMPMMMSLGGMVMMGGMTMVGMMAQMIIGKIAFVAGTAILVAKMALMISLVTALKKIVAAETHYAHSHHGHDHGSWHRNFLADHESNPAFLKS